MSAHEIEIMRSVEDNFWWYRALRARVVQCLPAQSDFSLLDAGCGSGGMLAYVRKRFPKADLTGLDFSERAVELTRERELGATLLQGSTDALPFEDASFDVVLSLDVLTIAGVDAHRALREIHRVLRPGGLLIVNLPAFEFLRGSHDAAVNTARRYTRPGLQRMLRASGFRVEHSTYWNMSLMPAVAAVRYLSRGPARRGNVRSDLKPIFAPLNAALTAVTRLELALSRRVPLPLGTSVFAVARK